HKFWYLQQMLQRINGNSVNTYVMALSELEGRAHKCYAECIRQTKDEVVEMMILDGCVIIELFRKRGNQDLKDGCDPIFHMDWM
ncbi:DUF247 domain-containing protein, partial [Salmonella sp. gx-f5]|nr:DUF247 domain-containing protein [Salmonella sp. gx-f5]